MAPQSASASASTPAAASRNVADQLLDYLALEGVNTLFGIPGAGVAHLLARLHDRADQFTFLVCRQETGAAYIADGYFRATGTPGVVLVTSGPGATNALTGTMNAYFGGAAVLTLTGEVGEGFLGRGYLQEGTDCGLNIRDVFAAATRYSADIIDATSAPTLIEQALRDMLSIPRRAVRLGISDNVAATTVVSTSLPPQRSTAYRSIGGGAPEAGVRHVLQVLSEARRPLILLGNGCRAAVRDAETARALRCLGEWWQIPVMTTTDGKGVFPETHPLSLRSYGFAGCQWPQYWMIGPDKKPAHDALVVIGSSLGELATNKWNPMLIPNGPFVQVDVDQSVIGRGFPITEGIVAEAGAFIRALWAGAPVWPRDEAAVERRGSEIAALKQQHSPLSAPDQYQSEAAPLQPAALCRVLNEVLPDDALVFIDSGNCVGWGVHCLIIHGRQESHSALAMGPMGFAVCAVIGARYGRPDRLCLALVGDGAFLMQLGEVSTAAAHKIGAVWVVLDDNDLNMVTQGQSMAFKTSYRGDYALGTPDLRKAAEGLGADAYEIFRPSDLHGIWSKVLAGANAGRPQVIVAHIDAAAMPPYYLPPYWAQS